MTAHRLIAFAVAFGFLSNANAQPSSLALCQDHATEVTRYFELTKQLLEKDPSNRDGLIEAARQQVLARQAHRAQRRAAFELHQQHCAVAIQRAWLRSSHKS